MNINEFQDKAVTTQLPRSQLSFCIQKYSRQARPGQAGASDRNESEEKLFIFSIRDNTSDQRVAVTKQEYPLH